MRIHVVTVQHGVAEGLTGAVWSFAGHQRTRSSSVSGRVQPATAFGRPRSVYGDLRSARSASFHDGSSEIRRHALNRASLD
jgi:hypothetical protein